MERETLKQTFWDRLFFYPTDAHYIQALALNLGLKNGEEYRLFSVMGAQELSNTLPLAVYRNFQAIGPNDPMFRFNLHLHTQASDGAFDVKELLEQAATYADAIASLVPNDGMPVLTIAVTDHDCMDNLLPVLKELTQHYEKYQNLRVVLGIEMGAVWKDQSMQRVPMEYELMFYGVNPFDENIKLFLQLHQETRNKARDEIIRRLVERYPWADISKEDALAQDPLLAKNQGLGYAERLTRYAVSKVNDASRNEEIKHLCHTINHDFNPPAELDPYQNTDDIFDLWIQSGFGFLGVAHPAKINAGKFLSQSFIDTCNNRCLDAGQEILWQFMLMLKNKGIRALETNYQFDNAALQDAQKMITGELAVNPNYGAYLWVKLFNDFKNLYGLLGTGGYDSHNKLITTR